MMNTKVGNGGDSHSGASSVSLHPRLYKSLKRTYALFGEPYGGIVEDDPIYDAAKIKLFSKVEDEYSIVKDMPNLPVNTPRTTQKTETPSSSTQPLLITGGKDSDETKKDYDGKPVTGSLPIPGQPGVSITEQTALETPVSEENYTKLLNQLPSKRLDTERKTSHSIVEYKKAAGIDERFKAPSHALTTMSPGIVYTKPEWHAPWKLMRVISGHVGWVKSISVDPTNEWFATGSEDRTIKIWDLASGVLKLTLTGHINGISGLVVSPRHPYLFSAGEDKMIKCWDLEQNKVIRQYHGHLSAVYCISLHPTIDVLVTGGMDSTARVWDIRTKQAVFTLSGHSNAVLSCLTQSVDPQVITGSHDSTVRLWDLTTGKTMATLTNHKKSVRGLVMHPSEFTFASGAPDNIKQWKLPNGNFIKNLSGHNAIVNCLAVNQDNVMVSGGDNGTICFWDWKTGYKFQSLQTQVQPGSLDSEAGIYAMSFDLTGSRLITCEADKSIKVWREDENATEETHPVKDWRPSRKLQRF
eukprot:TRINITY_DN6061_c0_g1_i2.p1 TRINITY_DN6061_c0_g1~~TRINITY_DN6061_c0_g1_i2.p1  ORF type:complete len:553 (+),score=111.07 TRINITY_DN6061_c0_g1_i2:85-1659(+)